jgi:hypothetical protein
VLAMRPALSLICPPAATLAEANLPFYQLFQRLMRLEDA